MDAQTVANEQLTLTSTNSTTELNDGQNFGLTKEEAAQRYIAWQAHHQKESGWQKLYDDATHMLPPWFMFCSLLIGVITLGLLMLKYNPLLAPVKVAVIWLLKMWEKILEGGSNIMSKRK